MNARWNIAPVEWPADVSAAVAQFAPDGPLAWLDSASCGPGWSMIADRPIARLVQPIGQPAVLAADGRTLGTHANGWDLWQAAAREAEACPPPATPLAPGWIGYAGFEAADLLERLPRPGVDDLGLPRFDFHLFDRAILLDDARREAWALAAEEWQPGWRTREDREALDDWRARWNAAARCVSAPACPSRPVLTFEQSRSEFEARVLRALRYIAAGDIYQVNLAQRLRIEGLGDPLATWAALRRANPAPYGALLRCGDAAVLSVSPELFLETRGGLVRTRPIKGTRPRVGDPPLDAARRADLLASDKDAAELAMIIDLHRNDLGRVCRFGSIRVAHQRVLEVHASVFHTVAEVAGELRPDADALDLLRACFPAGSVTGVPKVRAIQIIRELEPVPRGVYTGAIGVLSLSGDLTLNVAIRTLQQRGPTGLLHVGGGIVAQSRPAAEYDETLAKAGGILRGLVPAPRRRGARRPRVARVPRDQ
jgi:para-aminobenzoate synthetase component 1